VGKRNRRSKNGNGAGREEVRWGVEWGGKMGGNKEGRGGEGKERTKKGGGGTGGGEEHRAKEKDAKDRGKRG